MPFPLTPAWWRYRAERKRIRDEDRREWLKQRQNASVLAAGGLAGADAATDIPGMRDGTAAGSGGGADGDGH
jgi:hypothetical protein